MTNKPDPMAAEFLHYNRWANLHLIDACSDLTPDQLDSSVPGTYGSIFDTLEHIYHNNPGSTGYRSTWHRWLGIYEIQSGSDGGIERDFP